MMAVPWRMMAVLPWRMMLWINNKYITIAKQTTLNGEYNGIQLYNIYNKRAVPYQK